MVSSARKTWHCPVVYKIKKPVRFSFVDASTPAKRYRLCQDEVRPNQLAPRLYQRVAAIAEERGSYVLIPDTIVTERNIREFAVVMHRLPTERMLDRMVDSGLIKLADIQELANKLAAFHATASTAQSKSWGSPPALARLINNTVAEAERLAADTVTRKRLAMVGQYTRRYLMSHLQSLGERVRRGPICEGHGDLRCDSVCFTPQGLTILDRVEYSEGLRYGDVASELASLVLDLEMAERPDLADVLMKAYVAASNDAGIADLLPFYKCYRAVFRGNLETLTSLQIELPLERRMLARHNVSRFFAVAETLATGSP
jgi:uncharacterized protein